VAGIREQASEGADGDHTNTTGQIVLTRSMTHRGSRESPISIVMEMKGCKLGGCPQWARDRGVTNLGYKNLTNFSATRKRVV